MAAEDKDTVDGINVAMGGDADDYDKMIVKVMADTEKLADKVKKDTTTMVDHVVKETNRASGAYQNMANEANKAAAAASKVGVPGGGTGAGMAEAMKAYGTIDMNKAFPEIAATRARLAELEVAEAGVASESTIMAAGLGIAAAAAATGAAAFFGTSFAIGGLEGAINAPRDAMEGFYIIIDKVTFGLTKYSETAKATAAASKGFDQQTFNNQELIKQKHQEALGIIQNVNKAVLELGETSANAEKKFLDGLARLGQLGATAQQIETVRDRAHDAFNAARVTDYIKKLEEEAYQHTHSKTEIMEHTLAVMNATSAEFARARALRTQMEAFDANKKAEEERKKEMEKAAREAEREAKERERERNKVIEEGKRLHDALRTPWEKSNDEAKKALDLYKKGAIGIEDLRRAMDKLSAGPKETTHKIKVITENDIGVKPNEFGSAEDLAARQAYLLNRAAKESSTGPQTVAALDAAIRRRGMAPAYNAVIKGEDGTLKPVPTGTAGSRELTAEEREMRKIETQMLTALNIIKDKTAARPIIIRPAGISK